MRDQILRWNQHKKIRRGWGEGDPRGDPERTREMGGFEALGKRIPGKAELEEQSRAHHALADPLRLTILYLLRDLPLCVCAISRFMNIAGSKLSYHLIILKESDLIEGEYHGNWILYSLTETGQKYTRDTV